jgi:hypothetical protein
LENRLHEKLTIQCATTYSVRFAHSDDITPFQISVRTVENHRHRIMKKLNLVTVSEMIKFAIQHGIESLR